MSNLENYSFTMHIKANKVGLSQYNFKTQEKVDIK